MNSNSYLIKKLNDLVDLFLTDGVQPSELSDNIFNHDYLGISFKRKDDSIIGELTFTEEIHDRMECILLRYYYTLERRVTRIEEEIKGKVHTVWDRTYTEEQIIIEILEIMSRNYSTKHINDFIKTLPKGLGEKLINADGHYAIG